MATARRRVMLRSVRYATHTVTIELERTGATFAGEAHGANGAGVPFAGWLGLIAALDALIVDEGERCFAPTACCPPLAATATARSEHDPKETLR
jgi:hypothetical protein